MWSAEGCRWTWNCLFQSALYCHCWWDWWWIHDIGVGEERDNRDDQLQALPFLEEVDWNSCRSQVDQDQQVQPQICHDLDNRWVFPSQKRRSTDSSLFHWLSLSLSIDHEGGRILTIACYPFIVFLVNVCTEAALCMYIYRDREFKLRYLCLCLCRAILLLAYWQVLMNI